MQSHWSYSSCIGSGSRAGSRNSCPGGGAFVAAPPPSLNSALTCYFTVQGARAGPHARYIAVEPYPASARACRANLQLNRVESVELVTAAAVAHTELPAVELHVPRDQLATPTVAFIGADSELPERMRRRVTQTISVSAVDRSEEHTSELQSRENLVCR